MFSFNGACVDDVPSFNTEVIVFEKSVLLKEFKTQKQLRKYLYYWIVYNRAIEYIHQNFLKVDVHVIIIDQ